MTALIKYSVGGIMMLVLLGCQPTAAPTASVPSVSPEQFETPTPEPTPSAAPEAVITPNADPEALSLYAGTYRCETLRHQAMNSITLATDGTYLTGAIAGNYTSNGKASILLTRGALLDTYVPQVTFYGQATPPALTLETIRIDHKLDLVCKRDTASSASPGNPSP